MGVTFYHNAYLDTIRRNLGYKKYYHLKHATPTNFDAYNRNSSRCHIAILHMPKQILIRSFKKRILSFRMRIRKKAISFTYAQNFKKVSSNSCICIDQQLIR